MTKKKSLDNLKIGSTNYNIREVPDLHHVNKKGRKQILHGECRELGSIILVNADDSPDNKIVTLYHEAFHAILNQGNYAEHDETTLILLSFGLVNLLRDNPDLVRVTLKHFEWQNPDSAGVNLEDEIYNS